MVEIKLANIPYQNITFPIDNFGDYKKINLYIRYDVCMYMDIYIDDKLVLTNMLCIPNGIIIPPTYKYISSQIKGNFLFKTLNDEYPIYTNFNKTNFLYYITNENENEML